MMVEGRFFGGLEMNEISALLGVSEATLFETGAPRKHGSLMS